MTCWQLSMWQTLKHWKSASSLKTQFVGLHLYPWLFLLRLSVHMFKCVGWCTFISESFFTCHSWLSSGACVTSRLPSSGIWCAVHDDIEQFVPVTLVKPECLYLWGSGFVILHFNVFLFMQLIWIYGLKFSASMQLISLIIAPAHRWAFSSWGDLNFL